MFKRLGLLISSVGLLAGGAILVVAPPASAISAPTGSPQQLYVAGLYGDYLSTGLSSAGPTCIFATCPSPATLTSTGVRAADSSGSSYWVPQLGLATTGTAPAATAMNTVSTAFINTSEFRNDLVAMGYTCYLGRAADATGLAYWDALKGVTINTLASAMLSGNEAFTATTNNNLSGTSCPGTATAADTTQVALGGGNFDTWLTGVYWDLLNRAPDSAGKTYYDGQYVKGTSLATIVTSILNSTEYETIQINDIYNHFLGRVGDASGVAFYLGLMKGGAGSTPEQVMAAITSSGEYWTITQGLGIRANN